MCLNIYVATPQPERLVAEHEEAPAFYTEDARFYGEERRPIVNEPYLYYAGAQTGCGCGFLHPEGEGPEAEEATRRAVAGLQAFVRHAADGGSVEVRLCWAGSERDEPRVRARLSAAEFSDPAVLVPFMETACDQPVHLVVRGAG